MSFLIIGTIKYPIHSYLTEDGIGYSAIPCQEPVGISYCRHWFRDKITVGHEHILIGEWLL